MPRQMHRRVTRAVRLYGKHGRTEHGHATYGPRGGTVGGPGRAELATVAASSKCWINKRSLRPPNRSRIPPANNTTPKNAPCPRRNPLLRPAAYDIADEGSQTLVETAPRGCDAASNIFASSSALRLHHTSPQM